MPLLCDEEVIQEQPDQAALTERYVEQAVRFIRNNREQPFFLYFAHMYVHLPIYPPEAFLKQSENGRYGGAVEHIDWSMAVILNELQRLGLDDDTLVVFTSDNGARGDNGGSNAPLRGRKGTTWEGGQRVPCLMRFPGSIPAGIVNSEIVTAMDFLPTFAGLAGANVPSDRAIDGKDIRPLMFGASGTVSPHRVFFYYSGENIEAVRLGKWKLHIRKRNVEIRELYDLEADIGETHNLYDRHPDVVKALEAEIQACREDIGDKAVETEGANCRPIGVVENPEPLTTYDPHHPYIIAMYDLEECRLETVICPTKRVWLLVVGAKQSVVVPAMVGNRTENFPKTVHSGTLSCADYPDSRAWWRRALSSPQTVEHPLPACRFQWQPSILSTDAPYGTGLSLKYGCGKLDLWLPGITIVGPSPGPMSVNATRRSI